MFFPQIYLLVAAGIAVSILIPILRRLLPKPGPAGVAGFWKKIKPYFVVGVFSLLTAILIVAFLGDSLQDWRAAILAGYTWDSTLQKVGT
jgi:hypothetical protein